MTVLPQILLGTFVSGVVSLLIAALFTLTAISRSATRLTGFSVGILLASALLDLLPEAAHELPSVNVGMAFLGGVLLFFLLEKICCWYHHRAGMRQASEFRPAGVMILVGDGIHNFVDGLLIAAAFLESPALGISVTVAVMAHEIPQEIGDFLVLLSSGYGRAKALLLNLVSGLTAMAGGLVGYFALPLVSEATPYALCIAAAGFIYIAVCKLIPAMRIKWRRPEIGLQMLLVSIGVGAVLLRGAHH
jgi:zinc and cadmium transporter